MPPAAGGRRAGARDVVQLIEAARTRAGVGGETGRAVVGACDRTTAPAWSAIVAGSDRAPAGAGASAVRRRWRDGREMTRSSRPRPTRISTSSRSGFLAGASRRLSFNVVGTAQPNPSCQCESVVAQVLGAKRRRERPEPERGTRPDRLRPGRPSRRVGRQPASSSRGVQMDCAGSRAFDAGWGTPVPQRSSPLGGQAHPPAPARPPPAPRRVASRETAFQRSNTIRRPPPGSGTPGDDRRCSSLACTPRPPTVGAGRARKSPARRRLALRPRMFHVEPPSGGR